MKKIITAENAPKAIGPYSAAIQSGDFVYLSGQLGLVPKTGRLISDPVGEQTRQAMRNIGEVLSAAGATFENIVKTTIFLIEVADFADVNEAYGSFFSGSYPARSTVAVNELPMNAKVEIEVIARL